jgi:hypothetical protein
LPATHSSCSIQAAPEVRDLDKHWDDMWLDAEQMQRETHVILASAVT